MAFNSSGALSGAASGATAGAAAGPWGAVIGGVVGGVAGGFFSKGQKAAASVATPISIQKAQSDALTANLANFGSASKLATQTNTYNQTEANRVLETAMPGVTALRDRLMTSINSDLNSETSMPQEMQDQIARYAAEKGISRGTSGGFNHFSLVKDFGFNLVDWKNAQRARALNTLSSVYGITPRVNPMTPMSSFVGTGDVAGAQQYNNDIAQGAENSRTAASNYNASMVNGAMQTAIAAGGGIFQSMYNKSDNGSSRYSYNPNQTNTDYSKKPQTSYNPASPNFPGNSLLNFINNPKK